MTGRFDAVQYDDISKEILTEIKAAFLTMEVTLARLEEGRAKSLALTKIEEAYMWCGKSIRDAQLKRGVSEAQENWVKN